MGGCGSKSKKSKKKNEDKKSSTTTKVVEKDDADMNQVASTSTAESMSSSTSRNYEIYALHEKKSRRTGRYASLRDKFLAT